MKYCYTPRKFNQSSLDMIHKANQIIALYQKQGFTLTLRQLYYQFVARGLIPNKTREYSRLGNTISAARLAGLVDWSALEDRTRNLRTFPFWDTPRDILRSAAYSFRKDLWDRQPVYCEAWIEKDALVGVLEDACKDYRVPFFSCRGYTSQSEEHAAGMRIIEHLEHGQEVVVFHLGDHDPSGIDMTRDNEERLRLFIDAHTSEGGNFRLERLALNMDQVTTYNPPPNPAKATDSRFDGYQAIHGDESWELDALEPSVIKSLIVDHVSELIDQSAWVEAKEEEEEERAKLRKLAESYE